MKIRKSLVNQYSYFNSLIVITSFPQAGVKYGQNQDAVASFAKNRLISLKNQLTSLGGKIIVITDYQTKPEVYEDRGILVIRAFKKDHPSSLLQILSLTNKFKAIRNVLIEFEFATFGSTLTTALLPLLLAGLRLHAKTITVEIHQVLADLSQLAQHLGHKRNSLKNRLFTAGLQQFYFTIGQLADHLVVLEPELATKLNQLTNRNNVITIPHGVDTNVKRIAQADARKALGIKKSEFVVLNFGFLTWYKGSDLLVKTFANSKKLKRNNIKLILAGGESFNQKGKPHYQKYYRETAALAAKKDNILHTGFVAESDLSLYFAAADLVILPYRTFMSSSGPLSLALSFGKPFLLSGKLNAYCQGQDFLTAFNETGLRESNILFSLTETSLANKIIELKKQPVVLAQMARLSKNLAKKRSFARLSQHFIELFRTKNNFATRLAYNA